MSHAPQTAVIDLMTTLLSTTLGVQTSVLFPDSAELADIDYSLRKSIFTGLDAKELFCSMMERAEEKYIYSITDHFSANIFSCRFLKRRIAAAFSSAPT